MAVALVADQRPDTADGGRTAPARGRVPLARILGRRTAEELDVGEVLTHCPVLTLAPANAIPVPRGGRVHRGPVFDERHSIILPFLPLTWGFHTGRVRFHCQRSEKIGTPYHPGEGGSSSGHLPCSAPVDIFCGSSSVHCPPIPPCAVFTCGEDCQARAGGWRRKGDGGSSEDAAVTQRGRTTWPPWPGVHRLPGAGGARPSRRGAYPHGRGCAHTRGAARGGATDTDRSGVQEWTRQAACGSLLRGFTGLPLTCTSK